MEKERLQKVIANLGYCSRRKAEELILAGEVKVNGEVISQLGFKCYPTDEITIDDKIINNQNEQLVYYILNKPKYYICTASDPQNRKTIFELLPKDEGRLFSAGRLDYESSGLIIVTNDGDFANLITHPSTSLEKEYIVVCKNTSFGNEEKKLKEGLYVTRRGYKARPCECKLLDDNIEDNTSTYSIILHEGKKRQIRDMMMTLHHPVISLTRIRVGSLTLGRLKEKEYTCIDLNTINAIKEECKKNKSSN